MKIMLRYCAFIKIIRIAGKGTPLLFLLFCFAFLSIAVTAHAQDSTRPWTIQQCIVYAKTHNTGLQQADVNVREAQYDHLAAKGQLLPSIGASVTQNYNIGLSVDPITNVKKDQTTRSNSFGLSGNWTLFNGFSVLHNIKKTALDALATRYQKQQMENDLTINIVNAYLQILLNKELLDMARRVESLSRQQQADIQQQTDVGEKSASDLVDAQSQVASDRQQVVQADNNLIIARRTLAQYLQLKPVEHFRVAGDTAFLADTTLLSKSMDEVYHQALQIQPGVKLQQALIQSSRQNLKIARSNFLPSLVFSAGAGTDYSDQYILNGAKVPFSKQFNDNLGHYFIFSLNIPIFNNFYTYTTSKKAKLEILKAKEQSELERYQLWQAVQTVYSNASLSLRAYKAAMESYGAQKKAYGYAEERFKAGLITTYDEELVRNKMVTAESQMLQYKYQYWYNLLLLRFYFTNKVQGLGSQ
jgi:outer membrane protein